MDANIEKIFNVKIPEQQEKLKYELKAVRVNKDEYPTVAIIELLMHGVMIKIGRCAQRINYEQNWNTKENQEQRINGGVNKNYKRGEMNT